MPPDIQETRRESSRLLQVSWVVLFVCVALSVWTWREASLRLQNEADAAFDEQTRSFTQHLHQLIDHHLDVLVSFQAMFRVTGELNEQTFQAHYKTLNAQQEYPALLAVQYAPRIAQADKLAFEARTRADRSLQREGYPDFRVHPPGERPVSYTHLTLPTICSV